MHATPTHGLAVDPEVPIGPSVFEVDPSHPPTPPAGSRAIAITNADGTVICVTSFAPQIPIDEVAQRAFDFVDLYEYLTRSFGQPRLLR